MWLTKPPSWNKMFKVFFLLIDMDSLRIKYFFRHPRKMIVFTTDVRYKHYSDKLNIIRTWVCVYMFKYVLNLPEIYNSSLLLNTVLSKLNIFRTGYWHGFSAFVDWVVFISSSMSRLYWTYALQPSHLYSLEVRRR